MKYDNRPRTRQTFVVTGLEHVGARAGNERRVFHIHGSSGLLAIWGTAAKDMRNIEAIEAAKVQYGFPLEVECDWIEPDDYEAEHFRHKYWVWETDHLVVRSLGTPRS